MSLLRGLGDLSEDERDKLLDMSKDELIEEIEVLGYRPVKLAFVGVVSFLSGFFLGYFSAKPERKYIGPEIRD